MSLAVCFLSIYLSALLVGFVEKGAQGITLIWVANGLLLSYLLLAPRRRWPLYLAVGFAALMAGSLASYTVWHRAALLSIFNLIEVMIGAFALHGRTRQLPAFTERRYLLRFAGFAIVIGPLVGGLLFAWMALFSGHSFQLSAWLTWAACDGLGTAVTTPAYVAILRTHLRANSSWQKGLIYPVLLAIVATAAFSTARVPLIFLVYPLLLLVLVHKGLGWASFSTLYVAAAGSWLTFHGSGPFAMSAIIHPGEPSLLIQLFVGTGMFMLYNVSVVLENLRSSEHRQQNLATLHELVTENSRDAILITDTDGKADYISPALERMTGWKPEEVRSELLMLIHPDDRPLVKREVETSFQKGSVMVEYRTRTKSGAYIWVEANIKALKDRKTNSVTGTLRIIRDASERKHGEKQLQEAYQALETLAVTDALTGLANRRRFDHYLAGEWRRGIREQNPLSLLLMDVDLFKAYNDSYGHLRGDHCLKLIAAVTAETVNRSADLVARFGGEEFAVVLPNTEAEGAVQIAGKICQAIRARAFPHRADPKGTVSVSIGCATLRPKARLQESDLIELADRALYSAKRAGRDRVVHATTLNLQTELRALE